MIDDVRIYSTVLSAADIANLYTNINLVGYYNLNEGSGTTAIDDSGNGNNGTINGATYSSTTPFATGDSLSFNQASSNYVNLGSNSSIEVTGAITLSAWVYITSSGTSGVYPCVISNLTGSNTGFELIISDTNVPYLQLGDSSGHLQGLYDTTALPVNQWVFLTATYDPSSGTATFYRNGTQVSTDTGWGSTAIGASSEPVDIGIRPSDISPWRAFPGLIDDVRIYNTVLSPADIAILYTNINLVGYYNFNEGSGTTAIDDSGNGNNGTINGATYSSATPFTTGDSLSFNQASSNYVNLGSNSSIEVTGAITLSAWVYITSSGTSGVYPCVISNLTGSNTGFELIISDTNVPYLQLGDSSGHLQGLYDTTALPVNQWVFLTATYDPSSGTATFYRNGTQVSTDTGWGSTAIGASSEPVDIGIRPSDISPWRAFPGLIDDVRIYNTVLSAADIADLYNAGTGYVNGAGNEQTASPGYTYNYDADGNMITSTNTSTGDVWTYIYNFRNLMTGAVRETAATRSSPRSHIPTTLWTIGSAWTKMVPRRGRSMTAAIRSWTSTAQAPWKCGI